MRFLQADHVFDGEKYLSKDHVLVLNDQNLLTAIENLSTIDTNKIERFEGTISPGFVNAHCHLELSHLKGRIKSGTGLAQFARGIMTNRESVSLEKQKEEMLSADKEMYDAGIVLVGDISNSEASFDAKQQSKIFYHTFVELIGLNPAISKNVFEKGIELYSQLGNRNLSGSLAAHAPYSVSGELLKNISGFDAENHLPFSIHNQESIEETLFFLGEKSQFHDLYEFLKIDISWFKAPGTGSLQYISGFLDGGTTMLVHNTFTKKEDVKMYSQKNIFWCLCPGANLFIEKQLPDLTLFAGQNICIGTDSLASNTQLSILEEMNLIKKHSDFFSTEQLLKAATYGGASALNLSEDFGKLHLGKNAGINLVKEEGNTIKFIKKIC